MKVENQTNESMVVKDGNLASIFLGLGLFLAGGAVSYHIYFSEGLSKTLLVSSVMSILGVWVMFSASAIIIILDKTKGKIFYEKKYLANSVHSEYDMAYVLRVETRKQWRSESVTAAGGNRTTRSSLMVQSVLILKDNRVVPMGNAKSSGMSVSGILMGGQDKEVAVSRKVADFLGVPFEEVAPPSIGIGPIKVPGGF